MDVQVKATLVTEAAKRSTLIRLSDWLDASGQPLGVLCTEIDREAAACITNVLPGERPQLGISEDADSATQASHARRILEWGLDLVELGTELAGPDGARVRPAFYFDDDAPRHELSLDGRKLSEADLLRMSIEILRCSGYLGGAAEAAFLRRQRGRARDGRGAVEVLPGHGADAPAGVS